MHFDIKKYILKFANVVTLIRLVFFSISKNFLVMLAYGILVPT